MGFHRVRLSRFLTSFLLCRQRIRFYHCTCDLKVSSCHQVSRKQRIETNLQEVLDKYEDIKLIPRVITECELGKSFNSTAMEHHRFTVNIQEGDRSKKVRPYVPFESLYQKGFKYLRTYASGNNLQFDHSDPMEIKQMAAFIPLNKFLTEIEFHERCLRRDDEDIFIDKPEAYLTALLTNHLLSKLVSGNEYIINNQYKKEEKPMFCPCFDTVNCGERMSHRYGQTGMGYEKLWFGQPDVILSTGQEYNGCVLVVDDEEYEEEDDYVEHDEEDDEPWSSQAIAQCITFSFFQAKMKKHSRTICDGSLIPTLVLTPNKFYVHMYDHTNNVLLTSQPSPLWDEEGKHFRRSAVLQIWMVLNHLNFVPELNAIQIKYLGESAHIHKHLGRQIPLSELAERISFKSSFSTDKKGNAPITDIYSEYLLE